MLSKIISIQGKNFSSMSYIKVFIRAFLVMCFCANTFFSICHAQTAQLNIKSLQQKVALTFEQLNEQLKVRQQTYLNVHNDALKKVSTHTLNQMRANYSKELGMDVDLYIVNDDLVITQTTFDNDLGLDFKSDSFQDAQTFFAAAKGSFRPLVSNPTLEISTQQYKIYTVSTLPSGGFLEIGFNDPEIAFFFNQAKAKLEAESSIISTEVYLQYHGIQVSPLTITPAMTKHNREVLDKISYLEAVNNEVKKDLELFKPIKAGQLTIHKNNDFDGNYTMYLSLGNLSFIDAFIICKLKLSSKPRA